MSSKRKATSFAQGATKVGRASKVSTPGSATPQSVGNEASLEPSEVPNGFDKVVVRKVEKFDISRFPYTLGPGIIDTASKYFQPEQERDFTTLSLKPDHRNRLLWMNGWGKLIFESFHPLAPQVQDFLITIAEPISRPSFLHEYKLTTQSVYAAISVGLSSKDIVKNLDRFLKNKMPSNVIEYVTHCGTSYGKVKIVLRNNKYFMETVDPMAPQVLLKDAEIGLCRVQGKEKSTVSAPMRTEFAISGTNDAAGVREAEGLDGNKWNQEQTGRNSTAEEIYAALNEEDNDDEQDVVHAFQIKDDKVGKFAQRCLLLHYPALEEYYFRNDHVNANLEIDLRPATRIRPYHTHSNAFYLPPRGKEDCAVCGGGERNWNGFVVLRYGD